MKNFCLFYAPLFVVTFAVIFMVVSHLLALPDRDSGKSSFFGMTHAEVSDLTD
jgi:hypothetical protein